MKKLLLGLILLSSVGLIEASEPAQQELVHCYPSCQSYNDCPSDGYGYGYCNPSTGCCN